MENSSILILYFVFLNSIGFIVMGLDKRKAKKHAVRIRENTLWALAILGGAIGSYIGMRTFNHKTKKTIFRIGMPGLIILHLIIYIIYVS